MTFFQVICVIVTATILALIVVGVALRRMWWPAWPSSCGFHSVHFSDEPCECLVCGLIWLALAALFLFLGFGPVSSWVFG